MKMEIGQCLEHALDQLRDIWNEIGICEDQRGERQNVVLHHIRNLLSEMVTEEESLRQRLMKSVASSTEKVTTLCIELALQPYEVSLSPMDTKKVVIKLGLHLDFTFSLVNMCHDKFHTVTCMVAVVRYSSFRLRSSRQHIIIQTLFCGWYVGINFMYLSFLFNMNCPVLCK